MRVMAGLAAAVIVFSAGAVCAAPIEVYHARLSEMDHYNSNGERLETVAGIIRQDRANYHRFHMRDDEDTGDDFFESPANRQRLEVLLLNGHLTSHDQRTILRHEPLVTVRVYENYVDVEVE